MPKPYDTPPAAEALRPGPATIELVKSQVDALLTASPSYHALDRCDQQCLRSNLVKVASYSAELIRDDWYQSRRLGQTPMLRRKEVIEGPLERAKTATNGLASAQAAADDFRPAAADQVGRVTRETLNAVAFPTFVADLIKGTFQAIVNASIQQMEAYGQLLANVAKTVDQFMAENITDNQARDYLVGRYPGHFRLEVSDKAARLRVRDKADDQPKPNFKLDLNLPEDADLDDDVAEEKLVPAARRQLAQSRHSMLSTMVLMGINRIVVTSGRIKATMGFHIDAKDHGRVETASQFDWQNETRARFGYGGGLLGGIFGGPSGSVQTRNTVAYVSSTKKDSSDDLNVNADLTGEVELKFKSDYFPMERFAKPEMLALIQGHTPNPAANAPVTGSGQKAQGEGAK
ncbi:MAG TPA: hypothetical protein VNO70_27180 [Blastocatellia bacterium]|nr:hypothetical protein [Blastocatellia bacterium]